MIRLLLSIIILTLLITYVITPIISHIIDFLRKEGKRIDKVYSDTDDNNHDKKSNQ